jgi:hypothetical protein
MFNMPSKIKEKLSYAANRKDIKKREKATMKEGKLILGQLGNLLKSRMDDHDQDHHHHHSTEKDAIEVESSNLDSREVGALNTTKKLSREHSFEVGSNTQVNQLMDLLTKMNVTLNDMTSEQQK